jgi:DNA polymerase-3 subunit gamma/tau
VSDTSAQPRSLYRRHRPRTFADVVGQEAVVRTLRNAVERGKVHHAYLFVGSRGTGKTSMAKILAACLNCERGPTTEPCGECSSCLAIAAASSLDVIEMDAASNNSVDDIRELRESVAYAPVSGRRKVYILDEAHMLSTAAWNAFLKTLEEPPPNTVFVLATTEAGKVPATVVDRCHRFDFHRPSVEQIATVIRRAADAEGVTIPPAAVAALARSATGSFRDALGTLEQIVTYGGTEVALDDVLAVLGVADAGLLTETVDAIAAGDSPGALRALESYVEQGRDAAGFAADLERHARELLLVQALGEVPAELSLTPESDEALAAQAARVDHAVAVRLLELLGEALEAVRAGADARTRLELALVKAARPEVDGSTRALLARIERLETGLAGTPVPAQHTQDQPAAAPAQPVAVHASPQEPRQPIVATAAATQPDQHETPQAERPRELGSLAALWPAVIDVVRGENALLGALMAEARPVELRGEEIVAAFAPTAQFLKKKAERRANREIVLEALRAVTGVRWQISYELSDEADDAEGGGAPLSEEEWVRRFIEEFDAEELEGEWDAAEDAHADRAAASGRERGA